MELTYFPVRAYFLFQLSYEISQRGSERHVGRDYSLINGDCTGVIV